MTTNNIPPGYLSIALGLIGLLIFMNCGTTRSTYVLSPRVIDISKQPVEFDSIFDLKYDLSCTPGLLSSGSYTKNLTPGGFCDAAEWVAKQADYNLLDGIGGSLLDR